MIALPEDPTKRQIDAADPRTHAWVPANAGSGKTKVLIDRVVRLLRDGTPPQNILCLTYTKAAASEMQNRLFERLGRWAMLPDGQLAQDLRRLGQPGPYDAESLARARRLFASAIETPGGLRIQTIHAFCASLLRRFPLEAGVGPDFREIEDRAADLLREELADRIARDRPEVMAPVAALHNGENFDRFLRDITGTAAFARPADPEALRTALRLPEGFDDSLPIRIAWTGGEADLVARIADCFADAPKTYADFAATLSAIDHAHPDRAALETLFGLFLYAKDDASKSTNYPISKHTAAVRAAEPIAADLHAWMDRVAEACAVDKAIACHRASLALHGFGHALHTAYADAKAVRGMLDFDDLIIRTRDLLSDRAVADWVRFKLDGGIDHILVDEAQDTSPDQWEIIRILAEDFATGEGARPGLRRTLFVVGDRKQSIYSFQGAAPEAFEGMRAHFGQRMAAAGDVVLDMPLEHSFRSSPAILEVVDETFQGEAAEGVEDGISHVAFHAKLPGRVDLWPAVPPDPKEDEDRHWALPVDRPAPRDPKVRLAGMIAARIREMIDSRTQIAVTDRNRGTVLRPVTAGDILILVQRRSGIFPHLLRACKAAGLEVAGADRLKLGGELAVRDIAALLQVLALPEDELSLAAVLRSPLFGWSEAELYALAQPRPEGQLLWQALRGSPRARGRTLDMLTDLRAKADFLRPFDLIDRILNRWDGRARLLARLGDEAEDGIDALLSQALAFEGADVPSLTGFLGWLQSDDVEIKRQMDAQGDRIRIMTTHGAKGLEAPVVILPDAAERKWDRKETFVSLGGLPVWRASGKGQPPAVQDRLEEMTEAEVREWRRLLYVAMTRAETWLIVCAAGPAEDPRKSWHRIVAEAMDRLKAEDLDTPAGPGRRFRYGRQDDFDPVAPELARDVAEPSLPELGPVPALVRQTVLSPSDLGGAKVLPGEAGGDDDGEAARARGTALHRLLEHLPGVAPDRRAALGERLLSALGPDLPVVDGPGLIAEAIALIDAPDLSDIFGPESRAEVALSAAVPALDGRRMFGAIDRLIVTPDRVLAVDFKSNRLIPDRAEAVPEGLLRQMGAYAAMLAEIHPDRQIGTAILWTATARLMPLPETLVSAALGRVTLP